jgi:hypothetical protein
MAAAGPGLYVAATSGYPTPRRVLVWSVGGAAVAVGSETTGAYVPQLAAAPDGRLWVGWLDHGGIVHLRRSNAARTVWGAAVQVRRPKGMLEGYMLNLSAQLGKVDVLGRFASVSDLQVFHTQALPGLTVVATPGRFSHKRAKTLTVRVLDAGDPVSGARVSAAGETDTTGAKGTAKVTVGPFPRARSVVVRATAKGYHAAATRVRAR